MNQSNEVEEIDTRSRREKLSDWWHKEVKVRVKALVYTAGILIILVASFQVQNAQLNSARLQDVEDRQDQNCQIRIKTRDDLRSILFYVVDISDVLPGNPDAETYTKNRIAFIEKKYPIITEADCA